MWWSLLAQTVAPPGPMDGAANWVPVMANFGVSVCLVLYLVTYANPKERREWAETLKNVLREQRLDHDKWQKDRDESWTKILSVVTDARFEVLRELKGSIADGKEKMQEFIDKVDQNFRVCLDELRRGVQK